jgi:Glycosyl hydrolases family 16/Secretion system C-terminal sorting domain
MRKVLIVLCLVGFRGVDLSGQTSEWAKVKNRIQPIDLYPIYAGQCQNYDQYVTIVEDQFNQGGLDHWLWKPTVGDDHHPLNASGTKEYCSEDNLHFVPTPSGLLQIEITDEPIFARGVDYQPDTLLSSDGEQNLRWWPYRSGAVTSRWGFSHGRYAISCKVPHGRSMWPAFWLYGACGNEIDIFEFQEDNNDHLHDRKISMSVHEELPCGGNINHDTETYNLGQNMTLALHTYEVTWSDFIIQFKVDGVVKRTLYHYYQRFNFFGGGGIHQYVPVVFCQLILPGGVYYEDPQFTDRMEEIIISGGVRPNADPALFPQTMDVDYFKLSEPVNCNSSLLINDISDIYGYRPFTQDGDRTYTAGTITVAPSGIIPLIENPNQFGQGDLLVLTATNEIILKPGLEVHANGNLIAQIKPCGSNKQLELDEMLPEVSDSESFYVMDGEVVEEDVAHAFIQNSETKREVSFFPNPGSDLITITNLEKGDEVYILDLLGREKKIIGIYNDGNAGIALQILESGIYFIQVKRSGEVVFSEKLIKIKN